MDKITISDEEKTEFIKNGTPNLIGALEKWGLEDAWQEYLYVSDKLFNLEGIKIISDDGPGYIGVVFADVSSDGGYLKNAEFSLEESLAKVQKLQDKFNIKEPPKIIVGTRSC